MLRRGALATATAARSAWLAAAQQRQSALLAQQQQGRAFAIGTDTSEDTHDDFKPKFKSPPTADGDVDAVIKRDIADNKVFIYMKGVPDAPMCGFSNMACRVLDAYGLQYGSRDVLSDPAVREGVKKFSGWPTIPQVFVKGEFVGGSDILMEMHKSGELEKLAEEVKK